MTLAARSASGAIAARGLAAIAMSFLAVLGFTMGFDVSQAAATHAYDTSGFMYDAGTNTAFDGKAEADLSWLSIGTGGGEALASSSGVGRIYGPAANLVAPQPGSGFIDPADVRFSQADASLNFSDGGTISDLSAGPWVSNRARGSLFVLELGSSAIALRRRVGR